MPERSSIPDFPPNPLGIQNPKPPTIHHAPRETVKQKKVLIAISLQPELVKTLDVLVDKQVYESRSHAVRALVKVGLEKTGTIY